MFSTLFNRYIFEADLFLEGPLHIGYGRSSELTDAPFIRDFEGRPIIPGSSLRGALRCHLERIARTLGMDSCLLFEGSDSKCLSTCGDTQDMLKSELDKLSGMRAKERKIQEFLNNDQNLCFTCRLFGSTYQASKIKIRDLPLNGVDSAQVPMTKNNVQIKVSGLSQQEPNYKLQIRDGIAIDRDTDTTVQGAKFDYEVAERGQYFNFEIFAENLNGRELGFLCLGIEEMMSGHVRLGGNKAAGLGEICLHNPRVQYFDENDGFGLKEYLNERKLRRKDTLAEVKTFLQEKRQIFLAGLSGGSPCL